MSFVISKFVSVKLLQKEGECYTNVFLCPGVIKLGLWEEVCVGDPDVQPGEKHCGRKVTIKDC